MGHGAPDGDGGPVLVLGWWADIASTASFYYTYYADVPDDQPWVSVRGTAWSINPGRGDDILVDQSVGYHLGWGASYYTLWNGNSWYSFDLWTVALPKAKALLITEADATVTASNGQTRLTGQDRYFVSRSTSRTRTDLSAMV